MLILTKGGWVMLPLLVCSILALTIVVERLLFFKKIAYSGKAEEVISLVDKGKTDEAANLIEGAREPLLKVLAAGLKNYHNPSKAMEAAAVIETGALKRGLPALDTIITLSPLLGLLGTIIGMISSFRIMNLSGIGEPHAITGGIAEALIATAAGIIVAVVSLIPYNYFLSRVEKELEIIEHYATRLELFLNTQDAQERQL